MFSFGIEYERAFSIAFASARFAAGSGPPSFAAPMIARESFEKSLPRLASAAPFLCLIEDHLLCPDPLRLPYGLEEELVDAGVVGELRVERRDENASRAREHRPAFVHGQHLDLRPRLLDPRRADEDAVQRLVLAGEVEVGLEALDLAPVGVPTHRDVDEPEVVAPEQDHPRTGAEDRRLEAPERLVEAVEPRELEDRRRLAARDDEPVEPVQLLRLPDLDDLLAEP